MSCSLFAQSVPSAEGPGGSIWVGAEASSFNPDWGCVGDNSPFSCWDHQLLGVAGFADVNRVVWRLGAEGEGRWLDWRGPGGSIQEANYFVGPRFQVLARRRFSVNVKVLAGISTFHHGSNGGGWAAYAPGATVGYRLTRRLMVRGDYEYQIWPDFVGKLGAHGLTPNGFSLGVSYRVFR
jgi:hypothetical protein